jgi:hypothetical protein
MAFNILLVWKKLPSLRWTGPRKGERKFTYHWIPPLVAGGHEP